MAVPSPPPNRPPPLSLRADYVVDDERYREILIAVGNEHLSESLLDASLQGVPVLVRRLKKLAHHGNREK